MPEPLFPPKPGPVLPCPECRDRGHKGHARIGNRKSRCGTCNRFAQAVRREALRRLKDRFAEEYRVIVMESEAACYRATLDEYTLRQMEGIK